MPKFEKLSKAEIEQLTKRKAPVLDLSEYLTYLGTLKTGDWGAVTLAEGETSRVVKRRLTAAAKQKGMTIKYKKSEDNRIIFQVK